jgi:hypothetical protein
MKENKPKMDSLRKLIGLFSLKKATPYSPLAITFVPPIFSTTSITFGFGGVARSSSDKRGLLASKECLDCLMEGFAVKCGFVLNPVLDNGTNAKDPDTSNEKT